MKKPTRKTGNKGKGKPPRRGRPKTGAQAIETAERYARVLELRKQGLTLQEIADVEGYAGTSGVHEALTKAIARTVAEPAEDVRALEMLRLDALFKKAWEKVEAGNLTLGDFVLRLMARRAKLLGLDAPAQSKVEVEGNFKGLSDAEVVSLAIDGTLDSNEWTAILVEKMKARGFKVTPPRE